MQYNVPVTRQENDKVFITVTLHSPTYVLIFAYMMYESYIIYSTTGIF